MRCILMLLMLFFSLNNYSYAFEEEKCQLIKVKHCLDNDVRIIDGFESKEQVVGSEGLKNICWKYEEQFLCVSKEKNTCEVLENNRGCRETQAICLEEGKLGLCKTLEKRFSCTSSFKQENDDKHLNNDDIKHIETEFHLLRDEKDLSSCEKSEIDKNCELVEETCVQGSEVRNINGKEVYKDCWEWDRKYVCKTDTLVDECKSLPKNCKILDKECIHWDKLNNICDHEEYSYVCEESETKHKECQGMQVCLSGVCDKYKRNSHNDFGKAIPKLKILAEMRSNSVEGCKCPDGRETCDTREIDSRSCKFFNGGSKKCTKAPQFNCCTDKGFLKEHLGGCNEQEKKLLELRKAGHCHPIGSWRGKGINTLKKYRSYCCFDSKLAKIIQVQGRQQLGIGWGYKKDPDCRSLTLEEIQRIDFDKIDFTDLSTEIVSKVFRNINNSKEQIKQKIGNYENSETMLNDKTTSEIINEKIRNFYGAKK